MKGFSVLFHAGRKTLGFVLVLTALSGTAMAIPAAPEMDPGSAATALALLAGGLTMLLGRRRK